MRIYCKDCVKQYNIEHRAERNAQSRIYNQKHPQQVKETQRRYRERHREQINEYAKIKEAKKRDWVRSFKKPCAKCGDSRLYVIDYHHIDPNTKELSLGTFSRGYGSRDKIQLEIKKCICLCRNCHTEFHWIYGIIPEKPVESLEEYLGKNPYNLIPNTDVEVTE